MLFSERKRMREIEEREAAGESLWTEEIPVEARVKIAHAWEATLDDGGYRQDELFASHLATVFKLDGIRQYAKHPEGFIGLTDTDKILTHVEAVRRAFEVARYDLDLFDDLVNDAFNGHRIAFRLVEGEVVPLSSDELHVEVVEPTLRLLVDSRFKAAHDSYLKALKEIAAADPGDAITDAATALQQTLVALGCKGNALGPLMKDAKNRGLLGSHDQPLIDGIGKFIDWVNSDRTATGDAHDHSDAVLADAWLVVHVVGALIVRLADASPRGSST